MAGKLASEELDEVSGVAASRTQPGIYWVHNDSGDRARVFAIDERGVLRLEVLLQGVAARDFEDLALYAREGEPDTLWIGDTGDNFGTRDSVTIYAVRAPEVGPSFRRIKVSARKIEVKYEDGSHDVETLLVDPRSGDLYLVEKGSLFSREQLVSVFRIGEEELRAPRATARRVARVPLGPTTGGDFLPDGAGLVVRNYSNALFWSRGASESVAAALTRKGCDVPLADLDEQGESIGFTHDGKSYLTISEGEHAPLHFTRLLRD